MKVRLRDSGFLSANGETVVAPDKSWLEKPAILVYAGKFESLDGPVEITPEKMERLMKRHNERLQKHRMAVGEENVPVGAFPPLQLDHSNKASDTVGRVIGEMYVAEHTLPSGDIVSALFTKKVRVLGRENVEKVEDGRFYNMSIGADLEEGIFSELTITPFPAAENASFLAKGDKTFIKQIDHKGYLIDVYQDVDGFCAEAAGCIETAKTEAEAIAKVKKFLDKIKLSTQGATMKFWEKLITRLMGAHKLSAEDAEKKAKELGSEEAAKMAKEMEDEEKSASDKKEKMKKHLMDKDKMSESDADEKMSKMSDDEKKELGAKVDDEEKKLSAEKDEEGKKQLAARKDKLTQLSTDFRKSTETSRLSLNKSRIGVRLSALKAHGKITPAEVKKVDMDKLAASNDATIDAVLKSYEDREPVVHMGAVGSVTSEAASAVAKRLKMSKLEEETRMNMPSKRKKLMEEQPNPTQASEAVPPPPVAEEQHSDLEADYQNFSKMMDTEPDKEKVKGELRKFMEKCRKMGGNMDSSSSTEAEAHLSALAQQVKMMETQFEEAIKLAQQ